MINTDTIVLWLIIIVPAIIGIVSLIFGIKLLKKYKKTKKKSHLIWGLILTFVIPGLIILFYLFITSKTLMVTYAPYPMMDYAPAPGF